MRPLPSLGLVGRGRWLLRSALDGLRATPLTSLAAVLTIAVVMALAGAFGLLLANLEGLVVRLGADVRVTAYLAPEVDEARARTLATRLSEENGVASVEWISSEAARERFVGSSDDRAAMLAALEQSPLPASLELALAPEARTAAGVETVVAVLRATPGVEDVVHEQDWIAGYTRALALLRAAGVVIGAALAAGAMLIVANTVRLALHARRQEIEILSLVGAGRAFIALPHLVEGLVEGAVGGAIALGLLVAAHALFGAALATGLDALAGGATLHFLGAGHALALVAGGAALGSLGAALSLLGGLRA